jgi:16S rRNA (adenine1518-N6/adenine1519-N6)-dimethyltransferase
MKLSEMRELLAARGIQLTKSLGQNFLHDQNQLDRIVALGAVAPGDRVLEIGPGLGPLTAKLLERGAEVFAIELDRRLVAFLEQRFAGEQRFRLVQDDALRYVKTSSRDWREWKLVANLPYSVASPTLVELALSRTPPERLVATLQLEVVQRITARAGEEAYGQLSLFLQLQYEPREWFKIPSGCFFPEPEVDSGCVQLVRREKPLLALEETALFQRIVKLSFSARRKMMFKLLKQQWPAEVITDAFARVGISPQARAETVALEQFVALTRIFADAKRKDD